MRSFNVVTLVSLGLLASTTLANSADLPEPPIIEIAPEVETPHHSGGWYLRGDIGYAHTSIDHVDVVVGQYENRVFRESDLDDSWTLSGGIGYQVTDYFRVDATVSHMFETNFDGDSSSGRFGATYPCSAQSTDGGDIDRCRSEDTTTFSATTILANAYLDLGTFSGITPYVGAGIGGSYVHWDELENNSICISNGDCLNEADDSYDTVHDTVHKGRAGWRFAYALHAGGSYDINHNLKFDAGYSYMHIEGGEMFGFAEDGNATQGHHGGIDVHEFKAGLRWSIH